MTKDKPIRKFQISSSVLRTRDKVELHLLLYHSLYKAKVPKAIEVLMWS